MVSTLLVAVATVAGMASDVAVKTWCTSRDWRLLVGGCVGWAVQCALWIPIFQRTGLARALNVSSTMWLVGATAVGVLWFGEKLGLRGWLGIACGVAALALLSKEG